MTTKLEDFSDEAQPEPNSAGPKDLVAVARARARSGPAGDTTVLGVYRCPDYVRSAIEAFSEEATNGALEPAGITLLEAGLAVIRRFPGLADIAAARKVVLTRGCAQTIYWFNNFPVVSVFAAGTDDSRKYSLHVPRSLHKEVAKLARSIGQSQSRLTLLALMAGLLQEPHLNRAEHRKAMVEALRDFKAMVESRGRDAEHLARAIPARNPVEDRQWTLTDVTGPAPTEAGDDDEP